MAWLTTGRRADGGARKHFAMTRFHSIDEASLQVLVERFYGRVRADTMIGPVFNAAIDDWPAHLRLLTDFWSSVVLRSGTYRGNPMAKHRQHPIRAEHFERWLALWQQTTAELFSDADATRLQAYAQRIGKGLSLGLGLRPGRDIGLAIIAGPGGATS